MWVEVYLHIFKLGIRGGKAVSLKPRALNLQGKIPRKKYNMKLARKRKQCRRCEEKLSLSGIEPRNLGSPARTVATILT